MNRKNEVLGAFFLVLFAGLVTLLVYMTNSYPLGSDVYGHLYKTNTLYREICNGNFFPIYNKNWYSGSELFRYSSPLVYYIICFFMLFTSGDIYSAFVIFLFFIYAIGGLGWLMFGRREGNIKLSVALGMLYMVLPDNIRIFYEEGNVARMMFTMLLPWIFYFVFDYLYYNRKRALIGLNILLVISVATHIMVSIMLGISIMIVCIFYSIFNKEIRRELGLLFDVALGYAEAGVVFVPGIIDSVVGENPTAAVEKTTSWSQAILISLNFFGRFNGLDIFYFGLSLFLLIIIGLISMRRRTATCFATGFAIFMGTSLIALPILSVVSLDNSEWVIRVVPVAEVVVLVGVLYWKQLNKKAIIVILVALAIDSAISVGYIANNRETIKEKEIRLENDGLLSEAIDIVDNRLAVMDLNLWESYPSYALTKDNRNVDCLIGWDDQGVFTTKEIVNLNDAFNEGFYYYVFDRLYIYGCDTVTVNREAVINDLFEGRMIEAAQSKGYEVVSSNDTAILFKNSRVCGQYGIIENYDNVCIGESAEYISYLYPSFYKLKDESLDDYSFEDLKQYKKIFLSGPTYTDKNHAEELVRQLSDAGVKVYIDMNNLQDEKSIGRNSFLGVVAQPITFTDAFPVIEKSNGSQFKLPFHSEKYGAWRTVYFTNLETVTRKTQYSKGKYLDYLGKSPNENITFIGLNLVYYCKESPDNENLYSFLDEIFEESRTETPDHGYVPLAVTVENNVVKIVSPKNGVLTNVANLEGFVSERNLGRERFVIVDSGATKMRLKRAYLKEGILCSIVGLLIALYFWKLSGVYVKEDY